jgi:hypothetical protein
VYDMAGAKYSNDGMEEKGAVVHLITALRRTLVFVSSDKVPTGQQQPELEGPSHN